MTYLDDLRSQLKVELSKTSHDKVKEAERLRNLAALTEKFAAKADALSQQLGQKMPELDEKIINKKRQIEALRKETEDVRIKCDHEIDKML